MNEITLQWNYFSRIVALSIFALLYGIGGIRGKWKRRFIAPFILVVLLSIYALLAKVFTFWMWAYYPLLVGALCLGYGADFFFDKVKKRFIFGLAVGIAALPVAYVTGQWLLYGLHIFLNVLCSVVLGTQNPIPARGEETILGFMIGFLPLFMV